MHTSWKVRSCAVAFLLFAQSTAELSAGEGLLGRWSRGHRWHAPYSREANHGLIHYPNVTYWSSDQRDARLGATEHTGYAIEKVAPSPWSYRSIAPYPNHFRYSYGDSYGWGDCHDCRN